MASLTDAVIVARLEVVREVLLAGGRLSDASRKIGFHRAYVLAQFLKKRMAYDGWPVDPAVLDAAIAKAREGAQLLPPPETFGTPAQRRVMAAAAAGFGLTADELRSGDRARKKARARQAACWALREGWPALSYNSIGRMVARMDHSSAIYHCGVAGELRRRDPVFREICDSALAARDGGEAVIPRAVADMLERRAREEEARKKALNVHRDAQGLDDEPPPRLPKNDAAVTGAARLQKGSERLLAAIARAYPERVVGFVGEPAPEVVQMVEVA